jgi:hypothetical protein
MYRTRLHALGPLCLGMKIFRENRMCLFPRRYFTANKIRTYNSHCRHSARTQFDGLADRESSGFRDTGAFIVPDPRKRLTRETLFLRHGRGRLEDNILERALNRAFLEEECLVLPDAERSAGRDFLIIRFTPALLCCANAFDYPDRLSARPGN